MAFRRLDQRRSGRLRGRAFRSHIEGGRPAPRSGIEVNTLQRFLARRRMPTLPADISTCWRNQASPAPGGCGRFSSRSGRRTRAGDRRHSAASGRGRGQTIPADAESRHADRTARDHRAAERPGAAAPGGAPAKGETEKGVALPLQSKAGSRSIDYGDAVDGSQTVRADRVLVTGDQLPTGVADTVPKAALALYSGNIAPAAERNP